MSDEKKKCDALTQAGNPCKRYAQEGSNYCYAHRNYEPASSEADSVEEAIKGPQPERLEDVASVRAALDELNATVEALRQRTPNFSPPPFSATALLDWLRNNFEQYSPQLFKDIGETLTEATAEDFKDPDTWRGIWYLISYSVKQESTDLYEKLSQQASANPTLRKGMKAFDGLPTIRESREKIESIPAVKQTKQFIDGLPGVKQSKELLSSLPGASVVSSLGEAIDDAAPKDFLDKDTWSGIWYVVNHSLETEWQALKQRVSDDDADEDEIIEVS